MEIDGIAGHGLKEEGRVKTDQAREGVGVRTGVHYVVGFSAGSFYFYCTLMSRRGALERKMKRAEQ